MHDRACGRGAAAFGVAALLAAIGTAPAAADDTAGFYRGKTINLVVSTAAGGGYDLWARLLSRHFSKHIPGNPGIVVQNTPGSGGLRVMNALANVSPRDGSVLAIVHSTAPFTPLLEPQRGKFDAAAYGYLGSMAQEVSVCLAWGTAAVKKLEDAKSKPILVGSTGAGSHMELYPRLMNALYGTQFKVVAGYPGGNDIFLAMEKGEVEGRCGVTMPALRNVRPQWLTEKKVNFLVQTGMQRDDTAELKNVPMLLDWARNERERQMMELLFANGDMQVPVLTPPGVPPARLAALRAAFKRALADPALIEDAARQRMDVRYVSGEDVEALVRRIFATPADVVAATIAAVEAK